MEIHLVASCCHRFVIYYKVVFRHNRYDVEIGAKVKGLFNKNKIFG